jgi:hypothetical protein
MIRMCAHARWPRGSLCFMIAKEAKSKLSEPLLGVSRCGSCSQDLEALSHGKEV